MQFRDSMLLTGLLLAAGALSTGQPARAQVPDSGAVIRTETRLVLVDTVVVDKKGNYVSDLTTKDFRVWEDDKEQVIKSFSFEAGQAAPSAPRTRYLVLFFDNSTLKPSDQLSVRDAAAKFVDSNAGPDRQMAIINYGGSVRIAQNFTADTERLKQVVKGVKFSPVSPNQQVQVASLGTPNLGRAESEFGARSIFLALRSVARSLSTVPGRKTLVLLTAGFPLTDQTRSELTAAIDACNRANVAVYPVDARGLVAPGGSDVSSPPGAALRPASNDRLLASLGTAGIASLLRTASVAPPGLAFFQRPGGPGGPPSGGGQGPGAGRPSSPSPSPSPSPSTPRSPTPTTPTPGTRTPTPNNPGTPGRGNPNPGGGNNPNRPGGNTNMPYGSNVYGPNSQPRTIMPTFPKPVPDAQEMLYALAQGTGGFVILNTNDLLGGMQKIAKEQDAFYLIGYSPAQATDGSCHKLRVKVERGGMTVRARSGYCNVKPVDLLAGQLAGKELELQVASAQPGTVTAAMQLPFFYNAPNAARVNVAMEIPPEAFRFQKVKGKFHSEMNLLGIAYKADNSVAARFSDTIKLDLENKKEVEAFQKEAFHYENQFDIASGQYQLKLAFSSGGGTFGKLERPLAIETYESNQFSLSGIAIGKDIHPLSDMGLGLDAALVEGRTPLVVKGLQITPTGSTRFKTTDKPVVYVEIYDPALADANPPEVGLELRVVDAKTGAEKQATGTVSVGPMIRPGNPVIPIGLKLFAGQLPPGAYRAEMKAVNSRGRSSVLRTAQFEVE